MEKLMPLSKLASLQLFLLVDVCEWELHAILVNVAIKLELY